LSEDEILAVIRRHPEAIAEALESKPELLTSLMVRLAPWDRFATKEDIKMLIDLINKRFEAIDKRFEAIDKRFEDLISYSDKRFEDINKRFEELRAYSDKRFEELKAYSDKRFEDINRRFEDINNRFEDMNRRFEDLTHYIDKRVGLIEKLLIGFNLPILIAIITMLIRLFIR
jgi:hypothetical protein